MEVSSFKGWFHPLCGVSYCPELIKETLALDEEIKALAEDMHKQKSLIVMGRGYNFATCMEGALVSVAVH